MPPILFSSIFNIWSFSLHQNNPLFSLYCSWRGAPSFIVTS